MKYGLERRRVFLGFLFLGFLCGCSFMIDVEDLEGEPCAHQMCGPSLVFDGYDCGTCTGQFDFCSVMGQCVNDCLGLECGPSPNEVIDCGSCDESEGEECNSEGFCHYCPEGLSGDDCLDCAGGRYEEKSGLCWQDPPNESEYIYTQALTYCNQLDHAGHTDWTLPSIEDYVDEQVGLLDDCDYVFDDFWSRYNWECNSCLDSESCEEMFGFDNRSYWSSSMYLSYTDAAWGIFFSASEVVGDVTPTSLDLSVRCVRSL